MYWYGVETRFFGPTNFRGSRIRVTLTGWDPVWKKCRLWWSYDHSQSADDNHLQAAYAFMRKYEIHHKITCGAYTGRGYVFTTERR